MLISSRLTRPRPASSNRSNTSLSKLWRLGSAKTRMNSHNLARFEGFLLIIPLGLDMGGRKTCDLSVFTEENMPDKTRLMKELKDIQ